MNLLTGETALTFRAIVKRVWNPQLPLFYLFAVAGLLLTGVWGGGWLAGIYCKKRRWEISLAKLARERTACSIAPFSTNAITWGENLTLQLCPDLQHGWQMASLQIRLVPGGHVYSLLPTDRTAYDEFRQTHSGERWYHDDSDSFRLTTNPISFSDSPQLILEVQRCKYSQVQYTNHVLALPFPEKQKLLQCVTDGTIPFANVLAIHAVVVTSDDFVLGTFSSAKKDYFSQLWSFSIEEQLRADDLAPSDLRARAVAWMKRALFEELGVTEADYITDNLRVLSVFIEGHNLNCGLCCIARLSSDCHTLEDIISAKPRTDYEFSDHRFFSIDEAISILRHPTIPLHPTSEYRLFVVLSHLLTPPTLARRLFQRAK